MQCASTNPDAVACAAGVNIPLLPKVLAPTFVFGSRRPQVLGKLPLDQYPALQMLEKGERYDRTMMRGPAVVTLIAHIHIQTATGQDPSAIPATDANNYADLVEDLIETGAGQFGEGANRLVLNLPDSSSGIPGVINPNGPVFVTRTSGREVVYLADNDLVFSEQIIEVEVIATH